MLNRKILCSLVVGLAAVKIYKEVRKSNKHKYCKLEQLRKEQRCAVNRIGQLKKKLKNISEKIDDI